MSIQGVQVGCVHGRFQPFHLGHLEYVLRGYELCDRLYVGLANSDPSHVRFDSSAPHRDLEDSNPFLYCERMEMVLGSLEEAGIDLRHLRIVPFPINKPEILHYYVPLEAIQFITIYDDWGDRKLAVLEERGYKTSVLWRRTAKFTTGSHVRAFLRGGRSIADLVPAFVDRYIQQVAVRGIHA
jgi:nicotinamide-nucleotide adenylyltransferase/phosphinothricin biosynthesis protein PhpF